MGKPMIRPPRGVRALHESRATRAGHERAAVLREIFDSLDDGDFQISRAEYVRLMGTRGVAAAEANVGAFPLHPHLHLLLGDIRRHGQLGQQSHDSRASPPRQLDVGNIRLIQTLV